jgi:selenide,water dikinase
MTSFLVSKIHSVMRRMTTNMINTLPKNDIVLLGVGHTNAHVLKMWRMSPLPNTRLTCVSNFPTTTYSGMLPGVLAEQYTQERMEIDLVRLCSAANARLVIGHVTGLDLAGKHLLFDDRAPVPFDWLSIGIGSIPVARGIERADHSTVTIKPMQTFLHRLEARLDEVAGQHKPLIRIAIVGGGAGGVEVAFCLPNRLRTILGHLPFHLTLIGASEQLIGGVTEKTSNLARKQLEARGVEIHLGRKVVSIACGKLTLDNHQQLTADLVILATNASGPALVSKLGLATDEQGFLLTRPTLQTLENESIFAVGDTGTIRGSETPKAGVYAVRQGPVLWENLGHALRSEPLVDYVPQRGFLKLFNTGDGTAIGEYKGVTFSGPYAWKIKDWIDGRFMDMYQDYAPSMHRSAPLDAELQMRCAGCGGKVSGSVLSRVVSRLDIPTSEHVVVGLHNPDDAAIIRPVPGAAINMTVDFFASPFDDPYTVGRIAALNAASDCYAMGGTPVAALASVTLPVGPSNQQEHTLYELLAGALHEFTPMGATLAGGHTLEGPQLTIGFSMLGMQKDSPRKKGNLRPGDQLILTKPLGSGILLAAHQQAKCRAPWWEPLVHTLLLSNQYAAGLCERFDIQALTDITGFGLAGHLVEMLRASGTSAEIRLSDLRLLPGVDELIAERVESTLAPANRLVETEIDVAESTRKSPRYQALFDPQTNGGLLLAVPERFVACAMAALGQQSAVPASVVGRVMGRGEPRLKVIE